MRAGQAVVTTPGEWVRYSSPESGGAEYIAVCTPAFSPSTVHRDLCGEAVQSSGAAAPLEPRRRPPPVPP